MDDVIRYPKQGDHICKEQLGHPLARKFPITQPARYQTRVLCEMLNDSQDCIVPIAERQMCNKIDTVGAEMTRRDRQRLEMTVGGLGTILGTLANLACTHNPSTVPMHTWPPNKQQQQCVHLSHSKISCARMCFIQQESTTCGVRLPHGCHHPQCGTGAQPHAMSLCGSEHVGLVRTN